MKHLNIVLFGVGNVGSTLIKQILEFTETQDSTRIQIKIPVIVNSSTAFFASNSIEKTWETDFKTFGFPYKLDDILKYVRQKDLKNLIAVDATASEGFVKNYKTLIKNGFHIVAANKIANTLSSQFYAELRELLVKNEKQFLYETNVGAGLPIIHTIQSLYASGEKVTNIRGVFSGSLSYIFNTFSENDQDFDEVITEAGRKGYTEPDPRVDLSGKDVARKLLILARELNIHSEFKDISIQDLVPIHLNGTSSLQNFIDNKKELNLPLQKLKNELKSDEVLRHVGELNVNSGSMEVKITREKRNSPFGSLQQADASFEIYTKSYGNRPLVIQGAGAGAAVTARGVFGDIIKISEKLD